MKRICLGLGVLCCLGSLTLATPQAATQLTYVKKDTRLETILASLKGSGFPTLEGTWHFIGPFDNRGEKAFEAVYPPEKEIDLKKTYAGKDGAVVGWKTFPSFRVGHINNLKLFKKNDHAFVYLYHEIVAPEAVLLPVSLGSDDSLAVWLNGERVLANNAVRAAAPNQDDAILKIKAGKNQLLVRVGNVSGDWAFYICPEFPIVLEAKFPRRLVRDFPDAPSVGTSITKAEAAHYRMVTLPMPADVVLEAGGLAVRPDGKLLACTRRGDVWLIANPNSDDSSTITYKRFASGLHEPLGLYVEGKDVYVVQRPELTKLVDRDGDDVADEYVTICDKWAVTGDYHEFAFGPAKDKDGNFFVTLNVGFGGGHQSKGPWRGWCVKITPKGELIPWATGLRSPNGVTMSPDGDLFYCDNQGEWVATNKMHHIRQGEFYGHQAGLRWVTQSPFAKTIDEKHKSGMLYDGQAGKTGVAGMPSHTPPCIWFPYGRMGQSLAEPQWDTTAGKFGPFAGQCFVGDQTKSKIMRVYLEKVNGRFQGACFPFRSGFQCGINRLAFGPDGSLYAGQTNRGWGSDGGKTYGLQRLVYTGALPLEIHAMKLTKAGFDLTFTKPLDPATAQRLAAYNLVSFTYNYWGTYGSPETDPRGEKIQRAELSNDRRTVSLSVNNLRRGRVYELRLVDVRSSDGDPVLHPEAYYTLNELP
jgi:hypothetical protein